MTTRYHCRYAWLPDGVAGDVMAQRLMLDGRDLGPASAQPMIAAAPGQHRLGLVDAGGAIVDEVRFTVR